MIAKQLHGDNFTDWKVGQPSMTSAQSLNDLNLQLKSKFSILEMKDIKQIQAERATEVSDELGISENLARALLIKNGWARQEAIDAYISDPDYVMKTFKFDLNIIKKTPNKGGEELFTCSVCYFECEPAEVVTMDDCDHKLCIDCFQGFC